eukprot:5557703-Pleurochrysis_carterae.AAC.1
MITVIEAYIIQYHARTVQGNHGLKVPRYQDIHTTMRLYKSGTLCGAPRHLSRVVGDSSGVGLSSANLLKCDNQYKNLEADEELRAHGEVGFEVGMSWRPGLLPVRTA